MTVNRIMVFAGTATLLQAVVQMTFTSLGIAQHFCVIDFLRGLPILLYLRILFFHNPSSCGSRINIGQAIDGIADQAFVLLNNEAFTAFRTFIINSINLGLSIIWIMASIIILKGGGKNEQSKGKRWPWLIVTVTVCGVDLVATVIYANDSFHTRTLDDVMNYISGIVSGTANVQLDTAWAAWVMVILYSKFVVFFVVNVILVVMVVIDNNIVHEDEVGIEQVEAPNLISPVPNEEILPPVQFNRIHAPVNELTPVSVDTQTSIAASVIPTPVMMTEETSERDEEVGSLPSISRVTTIPRAVFRRSFRRMKAFLFKKSPSPELRFKFNEESLEDSPERSPKMQHEGLKQKRTVNFPESLLSLPQRLENIIVDQQRRLDKAVIDTSGRRSPPRVSQSMPQLPSTSQPDGPRGRRGTTTELQSQLPWSYIPTPKRRMRDQLPPDEDLPPVPLPDYTALPRGRKDSVHRAASSLSELTQKRYYFTSLSEHPLTTNQADTLF